ncbi:MAG: Ig-like domain-containing protein [Bacteroidales bacterium]|nr:Ig-like domain-containing protein [Bacteroidales bacterium]
MEKSGLICTGLICLLAGWLPTAAQEQSDPVVYQDEEALLVWNFNTTAVGAANTVTPDGAFALAAADLGDITITGTGTGQAVTAEGNKVTFVKLNPAGSDKAVKWQVKPSAGFTFTPTRICAYIQRFATDVENGVSFSASVEGGAGIALGTYTAARYNKTQADDKYGSNSNYTNYVDITLTSEQRTRLSGSGVFTLSATVGVAAGKEGGFSDVRIYGLLNGTEIQVAKYALSIEASPAGSAKVSLNPHAAVYEAGSEVTVTAERSFGYRFVNWTDQTGTVVSTEPQFKYTVNAVTTLRANLEQVSTYSLALSVEAPANDYQVQLSPAPVNVDGKKMYEEGTTVTLTAMPNRIMSFAGWSNGETRGEITLPMTQDTALTATFAASDYIVGWDFWQSGGSNRKADFISEDNDAVQLVLRDDAGNTSGWLDKSQAVAGGYEGRPAAVNWRTGSAEGDVGHYYWQTMVNATAFTHLRVYSEMLYNFNAYQKQLVQFSLDGKDWTTLGTIFMEGEKHWTAGDFALPDTANNQPKVYVRWISDKTSSVAGAASANDGIAITNIFITGDAMLVNDGTAPRLVRTLPAQSAFNVPANGSVVLTFDEKVKIPEGARARLTASDGQVQELRPAVSAHTVSFEYRGLAYATDYRFVLPAGLVADLTDNSLDEEISISFRTRSKSLVSKRPYDFVVPDDGSLTQAFAAASRRGNVTQRFRIFVRRGTYVIPASTTVTREGTDGRQYPDATTVLATPNVSVIGEDRDATVIVNTVPGSEYYVSTEYGLQNPLEGIGRGDVLQLTGAAVNTYFQDITFKSGMEDATGRNIVINDQSNKTVMKNVCLWAYQDTYVSNNESGRFYFEGGVLRGRTDFLCGKGDVFYNAVTLQVCASGYITAPSQPGKYGYVFRDCVIKADKAGVDGTFTLGRPWGSGTPTCRYIDTRMEVQPSAAGWAEMSDGWPACFAEYGSVTARGSVVDLSARKRTFGQGHANNPLLTEAEADALTMDAVMGGTDGWDPTALTEQVSAPTGVLKDADTLRWDDSPYVLCWAVCLDGEVVGFTVEPRYTLTGPGVWSVRAANETGGLGVASEELSTGLDTAPAELRQDAVIYNLQGIRVKEAQRGLYIMNGKKILYK